MTELLNPPGQISAQLLDGANYALPNNSANSVAHVRVVDEVLPVITVTGVSMTEGDTTRTINFSLDKANGTDQVTITATLATNNTATETEDFTLSTTTVNIPSTGTTGTITVTVVDDAYDEADNETFVLNLTSTEATFGDRTFSSSVTNRIADNDPLPKVSIEADRFETEASGNFNNTIAVSLNQASRRTVTIPFTVTGTANFQDYLIDTNSPLVFTPDPTTKITPTTQNITYTIRGDYSREPEEQFTITLGAPTNGDTSGQNASSTITIIDDDAPPELSISVLPENAEVFESSTANARFTITANKNPTTNPLVFRYTISQNGNFLVSDPGVPQEATRRFTGSNNNYTATLDLPIHDDEVSEENGSVTVTLAGAGSSYSINSSSDRAQVTVYDNDIPVLSIADGIAVTEGSGTKATFVITSGNNVSERLNVRYLPDDGLSNFLIGDIAGNNQTAGLHFDGGRTANLELDIEDDEVAEEDGTISVKLLADNTTPVKYYLVNTDISASVAVSDDDTLQSPPVVVLSTEPQPAGSQNATIYVTVPSPQTNDMEVVVEYNYRTTDAGITPINYLYGEWRRTIATIPAIGTYGSITLPIKATGQSGTESRLMVRLVDGASYNLRPSQTDPIGVSSTPSTADEPLLSIRSVGGS